MKTGMMIGLALLLAGATLRASAMDIATLVAQAEAQRDANRAQIHDLAVTRQNTMLTPRGEQQLTVVTVTMGDKMRTTTTIPVPPKPGVPEGVKSMTNITLFDGTDHWAINSGGKQKLPASDNRASDGDRTLDFLDGATLAGDETVDGHDCWVIVPNAALKKTKFSKVWLAKHDLILIRGEGEEQGHAMRMQNSDFRKVIGEYQLAYRTELLRDNVSAGTMVIQEVKVNQGLTDDEFNAEKIPQPEGPSLQEMQQMMMQRGQPPQPK
jgi:outer membrane lipoprotein-sorting protein